MDLRLLFAPYIKGIIRSGVPTGIISSHQSTCVYVSRDFLKRLLLGENDVNNIKKATNTAYKT